MPKLMSVLVLTFAFAAAGCDAGIAGSSEIRNGSSPKPCQDGTCPTQSVSKDCSKADDCANDPDCPPCDEAPVDCKSGPCDTKSDQAESKCAPKVGE